MLLGEKLLGNKVTFDYRGRYSCVGNDYEVVGNVKKFDKDKFNECNFNKLVAYVMHKVGAKIRSIEVNGNTARVQLSGSPFEWEELIPVLIEAMPIVGVVMTVTAVALIIKNTPVWVIGLLIGGLWLLYESYKVDKEFRAMVEEVKKWI